MCALYPLQVDRVFSVVPGDALATNLQTLRGEDTVDEPDERVYMKVTCPLG